MKHLYLILLIVVALNVKAERPAIVFEIADPLIKEARITTPVNGTYFPGTLLIMSLAETTGKLAINNELTAAGIMQVYAGKSYSFFIKPGKSYTIRLDPKNTQAPFTFTGENSSGQYLLNQIRHPNYQGKAAGYKINGTSFNDVKLSVNKDADSERHQYTELFKQKKIDEEFYKYALLDIDYYYASVLSIIIYDHKEEPGFADAWPELFKTYNLQNAAATASSSYYDYADQYASWYQSYLRKKAGINKVYDMRKSNEYLLHWYNSYADNLTGKTQEYMLSRFLSQFMGMKKYETELVDLFKDFKKRYPASIYLTYLQPGADEIIAYHARVDSNKGTESTILTNYSNINTLSEILAQFKNRTLFVDLWATWCGPCKEEFTYSTDLKKYLKEKGADILYISTDLDERDKEWRAMITYYNLGGQHIRASDKLRQDLINVLWAGNKNYAIPRYLIIKNGQVVEKNALRPSDKQKLYSQISKYL